jgi:hypothetical protein
MIQALHLQFRQKKGRKSSLSRLEGGERALWKSKRVFGKIVGPLKMWDISHVTISESGADFSYLRREP